MILKSIFYSIAASLMVAAPAIAAVESIVLSNYEYERSYRPSEDRCVGEATFSNIETFPNATVYGSDNSMDYQPIDFTVHREEDGSFTINARIEQLPQYLESCEKVNPYEVLVVY